MTTYFIADLHLQAERPQMTAGFLAFLDTLQADDTLYILGDFFEVWIGDDYQPDWIQPINHALTRQTQRGLTLYLMHGNRDFLIGDDYCQRIGATLLPDPSVIHLNGQPVLLMHGDSLCTLDTEYMKVRAMVRTPIFAQQIAAQSIEQRLMLSAHFRNQSQTSNSQKSEDIMDVTDSEVGVALNTHQCDLMIHGHTHRPDVHTYPEPQGTHTRMVLGDWNDTTGWMIHDKNGALALIKFNFDELEPR